MDSSLSCGSLRMFVAPLIRINSVDLFQVVNSTVTDSFAFLKDAGFTPSAILDVGAFSGDWSRAGECLY